VREQSRGFRRPQAKGSGRNCTNALRRFCGRAPLMINLPVAAAAAGQSASALRVTAALTAAQTSFKSAGRMR